MSVIDAIEDYLCDRCDVLFADDGLVCDKAYNPEITANRAAFLNVVRDTIADQDAVGTYTAQIMENRTRRSECTRDAEIIRKNFKQYGGTLPNGLAIYISLQYITMPIQIVVGTETAYTLSANLNITVK